MLRALIFCQFMADIDMMASSYLTAFMWPMQRSASLHASCVAGIQCLQVVKPSHACCM